DGTNYVGWQIQQNGPSIQGRLQLALAELLGRPTQVLGAARTDSGVHALGQVACFDTERLLPMKAYWMGLSGLLPEDIAVVSAEEVAADFDPRRGAAGKRYRYVIGNRRTRSPLRRLSHWEIFQPLSVQAMREASAPLLGRHDFSAFRASDCQARHAVRELRQVEVSGEGGDEIRIDVEGTAFVKHMVRNIAGTLVEVGKARHGPGWVREVLDSKDRTRAGPTAPAHGLTLIEVLYRGAPAEGDDGEDA
ncbi:MAG TPA: tRNA pseudouridine(38-40) synthase TruA, partial [Myxococcaceae bacterium]|nr:tRNA pseudouridine(38-40) synthase TruA [Myxococcaceae bacterium]